MFRFREGAALSRDVYDRREKPASYGMQTSPCRNGTRCGFP